ncbi:MAG: Asp-tRNA(Asn)/Glu-tRNA(Gln) amidotransferase subunit GatB [Rickettsiaceae bacterium]|nr:Asp-tRNA(Asn)/Glu-tRNA(Gln) amidotransferase subunit GatB [Rickettsiaceae bacterium]MDP4832349.1 Asp-tRNA(Asn)/Glu-tRNA(Gln) amidotransferase subunit GatB [Rickettsiaceae bacterium]MDP5020173.1 Asp-tRNA(Asn)/Glu-tRNA(Gln) amidotransferase subunit GatB [Rickettsiaceae bacterium]MDP5082931.1 Asp-tRNA(Asn)/Glu-tRNA(Gln) amidotransferase subunit GatB [Rickettsiaceae bacterium]
MAYITGNTGEWEYVIGLEVHAQVSSKAKLFSGAATEFGAAPNTQVSLVDAALPGMLPVLNKYCVEQAIKTGLGINAEINKLSVFDRKNYFYADLPQGYQISQFYIPIVQNGHLHIRTEDGSEKRIRINRIHLEQDAGKSIHDQHPEYSLIDLNRSGIALMEVVTEPDMSSPYEAAEYVKKLRTLFRYVGSCDGNMDQGSMRCDANISVRKPGGELGTRCEIKNLNSVKNITKAIEYEAMRQVELLESGGTVDQETRLFDVNTGQTRTMRSKEDANDYRYFPDPDLLPVRVDDVLIEKLRAELPELPDAKIHRYVSELGLSQYDAEVIVADEDIAKYFEEASAGANAKNVANWISSELFGRLNKNSMMLSECKITPVMIRDLVALIEKGTISGKIAKTVFEEMFESGDAAEKIVEAKGLVQVSDRSSIAPIIDEVIAANPDSVEAYRSGKDKLFGFFVGQVMKKTGGKASPSMVNELLKEKL